MNMIIKIVLLLLITVGSVPQGYALSNQSDQWADDVVVAGGADDFSRWYEFNHFYYADFKVLASAGSGTMVLQFASDKAKLSIVEDTVVVPFVTATTTGLFGGPLTAFFVRIKVSCTVGPCTYDGWFTAKGQVR